MTQRDQQQSQTDSVSLTDIMSHPLIPAGDHDQPPPKRDDDHLQSGQENTTTHSQDGAGSSQTQKDAEEFEALGILTQYIGPSPPANPTRPQTDSPDQNIDRLTNKFKAKYEELVDSLDRAKGHKLSLDQAKQRGRTPSKLQITIKPMVVNREDPEFQRDWDKAIKESEGILLGALQTHLDKYIQNTNQKIRETAKRTWLDIKAIDKDKASPEIQKALQQCEEQRQTKALNRKRRKEEALQKQPQRKPRTSDK